MEWNEELEKRLKRRGESMHVEKLASHISTAKNLNASN